MPTITEPVKILLSQGIIIVCLFTTGVLLLAAAAWSVRHVRLLVLGRIPGTWSEDPATSRWGRNLQRYLPHAIQLLMLVTFGAYVAFTIPTELGEHLQRGDFSTAWRLAPMSPSSAWLVLTYVCGAWIVYKTPSLMAGPSHDGKIGNASGGMPSGGGPVSAGGSFAGDPPRSAK